ncbi:hypothetical protein [Intestinirhabdus alba]|jgi:hypothetical protein|uniref:Uracil-DNA glycosylase-like domain-containing protein n=1 Tax=Intestinirhabdus alba TaxID=2899544 RepID=A0A6L6ISV1_9ENTR|nr:hypothetical protein [Intestinirhabdus alba]MTH48818.1 hypothetical protein [Intestinirhabdus alba]
MEILRNAYTEILKKIDIEAFTLSEDRYSGVFLPIPFAEYWRSPVKIVLVGRETAGWNTLNGKNRLARAAGLIPGVTTEQAVAEAIARYEKYLPVKKDGTLTLTSRSRFMQYYFRLARALNISPRAIVYANLLAWDYHGRTPLLRPSKERQEVISVSLSLLAAQIMHLQPDVIIFASGARKTDFIIKRLFTGHLNGYTTAEVIPGKLWEFNAGETVCFRIAHPRVMRGHQEQRDEVIKRIRQRYSR